MRCFDLLPSEESLKDWDEGIKIYSTWEEFLINDLGKWEKYRGMGGVPESLDLLREIAAKRPQVIKYLTDDLVDKDYHQDLIEVRTGCVKYLEPKYMNPWIADLACSRSVQYFMHLPEEFQTKDRWWKALEWVLGWSMIEFHETKCLTKHLRMGDQMGFLNTVEDLERIDPADAKFWDVFGKDLQPFVHVWKESNKLVNPLVAYEASQKFKDSFSKARKIGQIVI